mmetsp:Transcript_22369/g.44990  ORF Transcript_22369/g.44990 Transcript_22369/m.44990 type:complete len:217 (+) Transcript_22369:118-768(+)
MEKNDSMGELRPAAQLRRGARAAKAPPTSAAPAKRITAPRASVPRAWGARSESPARWRARRASASCSAAGASAEKSSPRGRCINLRMATRTSTRPSRMAATVSASGASTPTRFANFSAAGAVATPSATPALESFRDCITDCALSPRPMLWPTALFLEAPPMQVSIKSPMPANPAIVCDRAPMRTAKRFISAHARVTKNAVGFTPSPSPSTMPAAMA